MAGVEEFLRSHTIVGFDTSLFVYEIEDIAPFASVTGPLFRGVQQGRVQAVSTVLMLTELLVRPLQLGLPSVASVWESMVGAFPNLTIVPVDRAISLRASALRAEYRVGTVDAIQIATSLLARASAFVTNDRRLTRVREIEVVLLDDLLEP